MLGMAGEMAGAARAARLGWNGLRVTMLVGASSGTASGAGASGYAYMTGPGPHIVEGFVGNALAGGLGGGLMGGGISAIGHGLARGISKYHGRPDNSLRAWRNLGGRYYDVHPSEGGEYSFLYSSWGSHV